MASQNPTVFPHSMEDLNGKVAGLRNDYTRKIYVTNRLDLERQEQLLDQLMQQQGSHPTEERQQRIIELRGLCEKMYKEE